MVLARRRQKTEMGVDGGRASRDDDVASSLVFHGNKRPF